MGGLPTVTDFIVKKTIKTKTSLSKKVPLRRLIPCSEMFHAGVERDGHTRNVSLVCPRLNCFCKCEAALWGVPRQVRLSACLDRVSELDMALNVNFLKVLETNPGD